MNTFVIVLGDENLTPDLVQEVESLAFIRGVYKLTDKAMLVRSYAGTPSPSRWWVAGVPAVARKCP